MPSGGSYEGTFCNGVKEGRGVFRYASGNVYEGGWRNDKKEGAGVFNCADGRSYVGTFMNDKKSGRGVMTFAADGKAARQGCSFTWNAGDRYDGGWKDDHRHGDCTYTFFNGEKFECTWVNGVCPEFEVRQAAVRAAPDAASAHARSSGRAIRTLASSNFRAAYTSAADIVKKQHEFFAAVDGFIAAICHRLGIPSSAGEDLFHRLQSESFENPQELLSQIQVAATRIWTSTQKLQGAGVLPALNIEFCSLLNRALRDDMAEVMPHLVVIVRAINALCIVRRESQSLKFPPNSVSHRGGALPKEHHAFFAAGVKYRVPMYLATSFSEDKAYEFW